MKNIKYLLLVSLVGFTGHEIQPRVRIQKDSRRRFDTPLVDITKVIPNIRIDLKYATADNFTKQVIYKKAKAYLVPEVAEQLKKVQDELAHYGLGLLIWDAFRPFSAQEKLWKICPDERYVADPSKGGRHTRGTTVDLTLVRLKNGSLVSMPTNFDDFSLLAWRDCEDVPAVDKKNRQLLREIMERHGFVGLKTEWWHFDYRGWNEFPVLMLDFSDLE